MNAEDVLRQALAAVDGAEIPSELRQAAFAKAVDLISGPREPQSDVSSSNGSRLAPAQIRLNNTNGGMLDKIGQKLGVDLAVVEAIFHEDEGEPALGIAPGKLPVAKTAATRDIALLISAARQAAELEEFTPASKIREIAEDYKRCDSSNFASAIGGMTESFTFKGTGQGRQVKLSRPGWEHAKELALRLTGGNS